MWALVLPSQTAVDRKLLMIDTGEEIPGEVMERFNHVHTLQTMEPRQTEDGEVVAKSIVYHLFLERSIVN